MAPTRRGIALVSFICFISVLASADSVSNIPITGSARQGFGQTTGDFNITGPSLTLVQGVGVGPSTIGFCTAGAVCDFSFSIGNSNASCPFCFGLSSGTVGNKSAPFLDPSLLFTGSAFYTGPTNSILVPFTITGTIAGYQLVNCTVPDANGCSLGARIFTLRIVGHGTGHPVFDALGDIVGINATFSGTATVIPEPISLALTSTGLLGIWIRKKISHSK
jgi:hypothetical protein